MGFLAEVLNELNLYLSKEKFISFSEISKSKCYSSFLVFEYIWMYALGLNNRSVSKTWIKIRYMESLWIHFFFGILSSKSNLWIKMRWVLIYFPLNELDFQTILRNEIHGTFLDTFFVKHFGLWFIWTIIQNIKDIKMICWIRYCILISY